jgi:hypothetical protein
MGTIDAPDTIDARRAAVGLPPMIWRRAPPPGERPPSDRAAHRSALDAWLREVGWR